MKLPCLFSLQKVKNIYIMERSGIKVRDKEEIILIIKKIFWKSIDKRGKSEYILCIAKKCGYSTKVQNMSGMQKNKTNKFHVKHKEDVEW